jgi:hypothetical protein
MNIEEINRKKSGDSENNNILNSLGLIIFVILSLVYLVLSTNYGLSGDFEIGRVFGIGLWFLLPWLFLTYKKVENEINYSSILPIIGIIFEISQLYTTERINKNEIDSFSRGLTKIEKKWFEQDVSDKDIREGYYEDVNNHIDSFLRKLKGKTRDIIKEVKIIKNKQFKLEDDFFESMKIIMEIDLLTSPIQNLEDINRYINSTEKIIEHINNRKNVSTKIRDSYLLHKRYGIELQVFTSIYLSYVNNEISENEYNGLIEKPYNKLVKTLEEMSQ